MLQKIILKDGAEFSFVKTENDIYVFLLVETYQQATILEKELKDKNIDSIVDFTSKMGWFVRVRQYDYKKLSDSFWFLFP